MRAAYIQRQRDELGRKSLVVLPVHYPKEILTAMNLLAVELWGPPGQPRGPEAGRLQAYVCAVVRNALAFLEGGHADVVDAALFPHTCDSVQGLATLVKDFGGWSKPQFVFQHPKGPTRASTRRYLVAEMRALAGELAELAGAELDLDKLRAAIKLHRTIDETKTRILAGRARLAMSDRELYGVLRRGEWLWPEDHLEELRTLELQLLPDAPVRKGVPLLVTGYVPEPMALLDALDDAGAYVVRDDWAAVGRRVVAPVHPIDVDAPADPFEALAALYYEAPQCPTRSLDQAGRMRRLIALYEQSGARGVIVHEPKFCEPEAFDVPAIKHAFGDRQIPLLYLETELETELAGQTTTRVEAFVEMVAGRRAA
jgi:benzoyl-CoA reductase/2-hydroxyglutaryl-CoA dehydratase subunit BcrC/BadD/HgdB